METNKSLDIGSWIVIFITLVLFVLALFAKGFTHDMLLEAGVFLVSVKLMLLAYKSNLMKESIEKKLDAIQSAIKRLDKQTHDQ